jgi:hypothetical protein
MAENRPAFGEDADQAFRVPSHFITVHYEALLVVANTRLGGQSSIAFYEMQASASVVASRLNTPVSFETCPNQFRSDRSRRPAGELALDLRET